MNGNKKPASTEVGVIIGRFQASKLHKAHRALIDEVFELHRKVVILLGVSPVKISRNNPLDYLTRELMLKSAYPRAVIMPLKDVPEDGLWSKMVDLQIESVIGDSSVTLYGSRDSFIPHYNGRYSAVKLPSSHEISGSETRDFDSKEVRKEFSFRAGVIYASYNRYPISYQCVDAIIWRPGSQPPQKKDGHLSITPDAPVVPEVLLGRKKTDPSGLWRFIGGFVQPEDDTLEDAAKREAIEETGGNLSLDSVRYLFSARVDDWRYKREKDKILTAVFAVQAIFGREEPSDDLDELQWFQLGDIQEELLVPEHAPLWGRVEAHLIPPTITVKN